MLSMVLVLTIVAIAFALGGKETKQAPSQAVTTGQWPGITDFQKGVVGKGTGWLNQPSTYPGMDAANQLWAGSQPNAQAAGGRLGEMLSPGWLTTPGTGLNAITAGMTAEQQRTLAESERALRMEFGEAGQRLSSPELAALSTTRQTSNDQLGQAIGQLQYQDYGSKLAMLPGLISLAQSNPQKAAELIAASGGDLARVLLALAQGGGGQTQILPGQITESGGGWLSDLLGSLATGVGGVVGKGLLK